MQMVFFALLVMVATLVAPSPAGAQPTREPGEGQLVRLGQVTVEPADAQIVVGELVRQGRVRGLRLVAREGGVVISRVVVRYANGQVHFEDREIVLAEGEQTRLIDPRYEDRRIDKVEVTFKSGRRAAPMTLEVWAPQSPEAMAEVRAYRGKTRSGKQPTTSKQPDQDAARPGASGPPTSGEPRSSASAPPDDPSAPYSGVAVYYGTNRKAEAERTMPDGRRLLTFSGEPSGSRDVAFGRAVVTVPKQRKPGTIPRPEISLIIRQIQFGDEDPVRHFTLLRVEKLDSDAFGSAIRSHLDAAERFPGQALVFVHGFNVSFDDALFRAAQLAHDMAFDGLPLVYSWPSAGRTEAYDLDRNRAADSGEHLLDFLNLVASTSGARDIHLVAHSTGAFVLMQALRAIQRTPGGTINRALGQIVFAAPDILSDSFRTDAERLQGLGKGITLYASSGDWALWVSGLLKTGRNPAGSVPRSGVPVLAAGVDSIDVSKLDTSYFALNHSGFGDHEPLVRDIGALMRGTRPPSARDGKFRERSDPQGNGRFWRYE